jgi:formate dehydrogenase major subunit
MAATAAARFPLHKKVFEGRSICPYCSVGCGVIIATDAAGHVLNTEGDADHPINGGALDPSQSPSPSSATAPIG